MQNMSCEARTNSFWNKYLVDDRQRSSQIPTHEGKQRDSKDASIIKKAPQRMKAPPPTHPHNKNKPHAANSLSYTRKNTPSPSAIITFIILLALGQPRLCRPPPRPL
jgi:hypothetical protein